MKRYLLSYKLPAANGSKTIEGNAYADLVKLNQPTLEELATMFKSDAEKDHGGKWGALQWTFIIALES